MGPLIPPIPEYPPSRLLTTRPREAPGNATRVLYGLMRDFTGTVHQPSPQGVRDVAPLTEGYGQFLLSAMAVIFIATVLYDWFTNELSWSAFDNIR